MDESEKIISFRKKEKRFAIQQPREKWTFTEQTAVDMLTAGILKIEKKYHDLFHEPLGGVSEVYCHIYNDEKVFEAICPYEPSCLDGAEIIAYAIIELINKVEEHENITKFTKTRFGVVPSCGFRDEN